MIKDEIRRIASLSSNDRQKMLDEINAVADYNRNNYAVLIEEYFKQK